MNGGTIFVLSLAVSFLLFVIYLARLSRRSQQDEAEQRRKEAGAPPLRRVG